MSRATKQAPAPEGGKASLLCNYQVRGSRNPDTPETWAKVPNCNHQIAQHNKYLKCLKTWISLRPKSIVIVRYQADTKLSNYNLQIDLGRKDGCRHLYASNDPRLDCKEIQPVYSKGDQFWVFIGRTDVEAETPILWPPHVKS